MSISNLTGSLEGYFRASCGKYASYGLTPSEAKLVLSQMMKQRRGL